MGRQAVKATLDTNVLLRAVVKDDPQQGQLAASLMQQATVLAIGTAALCEFVWVLGRGYKYNRAQILEVLETLLAIPAVCIDILATEAGLKLMRAGGDFADGVLAHEGRWLGGETFISFDRRAVTRLSEMGIPAQLLG